MLKEKSETLDKAQDWASDSSADIQEKKTEFTESTKRPNWLEENSYSNGDEHEATQ